MRLNSKLKMRGYLCYLDLVVVKLVEFERIIEEAMTIVASLVVLKLYL